MTPTQIKQRFGTRRFYEVRDTNQAKLCSDSIAIVTPYQELNLVCNVKSGHMEPDTTASIGPDDR